MKIEQEPKFQPITIVLETKEEVEIFRRLMQVAQNTRSALIEKEWSMSIRLTNWFSNEAQL